MPTSASAQQRVAFGVRGCHQRSPPRHNASTYMWAQVPILGERADRVDDPSMNESLDFYLHLRIANIHCEMVVVIGTVF